MLERRPGNFSYYVGVKSNSSMDLSQADFWFDEAR